MVFFGSYEDDCVSWVQWKGVRRVSTLTLNVRRWNASKTLYCGLWTAHKLNERRADNIRSRNYFPCFFSGSTDSLFQALSKWERVKTKQNKQLQAGTRFSLRSFSLNGSLEQTILLALVVDILTTSPQALLPTQNGEAGKYSRRVRPLCKSSQNVVFGTWPMCIIFVGKRFMKGIRPS